MEHVDKCPEHVQKIEETLKIFIELAVKGDYPLASYDVMKKFMAKECEKMPPGKNKYIFIADLYTRFHFLMLNISKISRRFFCQFGMVSPKYTIHRSNIKPIPCWAEIFALYGNNNIA